MLPIAIIPISLIGFVVSYHIYESKKRKKRLVCYVGKSCDAVVKSKYSTILGVPNEILGMLYYLISGIVVLVPYNGIFVVYGYSIRLLFVLLSGGAAIFSLGLIYIQGFILRDWCEFCLTSAGASILIFLLALN